MVGEGGVPQPGLDGGEAGYPGQVWMVGVYPIPGLRWGVPHPRSEGGTPFQVWGGGVPHLRCGVGVPWPGLDGGGYPAVRSGWWGVPPPTS